MRPSRRQAQDGVREVRTLFISDLHLGCPHAQSAACCEFIQTMRPQTLYIVGDFIDMWKLGRRWHWSDHCDAILDQIARWMAVGTIVKYLPGNHDSLLRQDRYRSMLPAAFGDVQIADEFVFESAAGMRMLVTHGDAFDVFETRAQWLSKGTTSIYSSILSFNRWLSRWRTVGVNPYAGCAVIKDRVKRWVRFISRFESALVDHANDRGCQGVICGHIHTPALWARFG